MTSCEGCSVFAQNLFSNLSLSYDLRPDQSLEYRCIRYDRRARHYTKLCQWFIKTVTGSFGKTARKEFIARPTTDTATRVLH